GLWSTLHAGSARASSRDPRDDRGDPSAGAGGRLGADGLQHRGRTADAGVAGRAPFGPPALPTSDGRPASPPIRPSHNGGPGPEPPAPMMTAPGPAGPRPVRAPRGTTLSCRGWPQEAALRMLMNNLDPEVAERPDDLIVYGGTGRAARNWACFDALVRALRTLADDETLLVQSGKPVGVFRSHPDAPRVLISNAMLVPAWATWDEFRRLEALGLTMYGQMTAGSWIYIGTQGIVQGTYETFAAVAR